LIGLRRPSLRASATMPTIWIQPSAPTDAGEYGGSSFMPTNRNCRPIASPFGQYCRAIVWLITASGAPRAISSRPQVRPCARGIWSSGKYSGLIRFARALGFSTALPRISIVVSPPFDGGVALVEIPADTTCGIAAIADRKRSKYSDRSVHVW
jgi:hypothetical protein